MKNKEEEGEEGEEPEEPLSNNVQNLILSDGVRRNMTTANFFFFYTTRFL